MSVEELVEAYGEAQHEAGALFHAEHENSALDYDLAIKKAESARAALLVAIAQGEPVAWRYMARGGTHYTLIRIKEQISSYDADRGVVPEPLYAGPKANAKEVTG